MARGAIVDQTSAMRIRASKIADGAAFSGNGVARLRLPRRIGKQRCFGIEDKMVRRGSTMSFQINRRYAPTYLVTRLQFRWPLRGNRRRPLRSGRASFINDEFSGKSIVGV
jgi:hypothetical protein